MKSLADFKRKLKIGTKLHCIYHQDFASRDKNQLPIYKDLDKGIREVSKKQTSSFALKTKKTDGTFQDTWCNFPKAKECIIKENSITILTKDLRGIYGYIGAGNTQYDNAPMIPILTYTIV